VDSVDIAKTTPVPFDVYYRTGWSYAGEPEQRKSWRRPRFIVRRGNEDVKIVVDTYWNYNDQAAKRSHVLDVITDQDGTFWTLLGQADPSGRGADWGDGSLWNGALVSGSSIERAQPPIAGQTGLGLARSVQLRFSTADSTAGKPWGIEAMTLKYINRMRTT
jgi:hypothetical protein